MPQYYIIRTLAVLLQNVLTFRRACPVVSIFGGSHIPCSSATSSWEYILSRLNIKTMVRVRQGIFILKPAQCTFANASTYHARCTLPREGQQIHRRELLRVLF